MYDDEPLSLHSNVWPRSTGSHMLLWGGRHPKTDIALVTLQTEMYHDNLLVSIPTLGWRLWVPACRYEEGWHPKTDIVLVHDVCRTYIFNNKCYLPLTKFSKKTFKCYDPNTFHPFNLAAFGVPGLPVWPMSCHGDQHALLKRNINSPLLLHPPISATFTDNLLHLILTASQSCYG